MAENFKKRYLRMETYIDPNCLKHKHNYSIKHLLIVTNINKHASSDYYNAKEYYYVLKCNECNSFIPDSVEGNFNHHILSNEPIDESLPVIEANTLQKNPHYNFSKLMDVKVR